MRRQRLHLFAALSLLLSMAAVSVSAEDFDYHPIATPEFEQVWARNDLPVSEGVAMRSWTWSPGGYTALLEEPYEEADGGFRQVQYFDKSRMEMPLTAGGDPSSPWFITQGLLATELMTGRLQLGHEEFERHEPADIPVAGDPDDTLGPTYATMGTFMDWGARPTGATITQVLTGDGTVFDNGDLAVYGVTDAHYDEVTGHNVASVFHDFITGSGIIYSGGEFVEGDIFENHLYAVGRPLAEAYWGWVKVNGVEQNVLIQCFERRCMTFTPDNPDGWKVESGNIGQHYHHWRYEILPSIPHAASFTAQPASDTNVVGETHQITVAVLDQHGAGFNGAGVHAEVTATTGDSEEHLGETMSGTSGDDGNGLVALSYDGSEIGTDTITVSVEGIDASQTVTKTWVDEDPASISITQSESVNTVGDSHTVTAEVEDEGGNPVPDGTEIEFTISGANSDEDGEAETEDGVATFTYTGETAGSDTIQASWEGVNSNFLTKTWEPGEPATITLSHDGDDTNFINSEHTVIAEVEDEFGNAVGSGYEIEFEIIDGPNDGEDGSDDTNSNGVATFTYTSNGDEGEDEIDAWWEEDPDVEAEDTLIKTWEVNPPQVTLDSSDMHNVEQDGTGEFVASVENPEPEDGGADYDAVRFDIEVGGPVDCSGGDDLDVWFEITDPGGVQGTFDCEGGDFVGYYGPEDGFTMEAGYSETTEFDIDVASDAPPGIYTVTVVLVSNPGESDAEDLHADSDSFTILSN